MGMLKPYSTLMIGMVLGYLVLPKAIAMVRR